MVIFVKVGSGVSVGSPCLIFNDRVLRYQRFPCQYVRQVEVHLCTYPSSRAEIIQTIYFVFMILLDFPRPFIGWSIPVMFAAG